MSSILQPIDGFTPNTQLPRLHFTRSVEEAGSFAKIYKIIKSMWEKTNPSVKIYHGGHEFFDPEFPCITIQVFSEIPADGWPKPRVVEVIPGTTGTTGSRNDLIQIAQLFELIIRADVFCTQNAGGAETAEEVLEAFKRFMIEFAYVFLKKGIGDIRYKKRFVDDNVVKIGDMYVVKRSLAYQVITQYVNYTLINHLEEIATEVMVVWDSDEIIEAPPLP
jgi:2-succinyl-5-enolpyruvyl-6-hydroxy-3-cyclohexene-1-carboxylate synthase